jgi:hypothetical protein
MTRSLFYLQLVLRPALQAHGSVHAAEGEEAFTRAARLGRARNRRTMECVSACSI